MSYQRAEWHSGLTYRQTCEMCKTVVEYNDYKLGFRPWYPDGFVYCPTCKKPLRHNENHAIDRQPAPVVNVDPAVPVFTEAPAAPVVDTAPAVPVFTEQPAQEPAFCSQCGKAFKAGDRFCSGCGSKREEETESPVAAPVFAPAEPVAEPAAPVFTPAESVADPIAEPEFAAGCEESAPAAAVPVFEPVVEPAAVPEFPERYETPAPAAAPKKVVLKEKMPIAAIVLMGIAVLLSVLRFFGNLRYMSGMSIFYQLMTFGGCGLMFAGMLLHRKKGQLLTGIGALTIAFEEIIAFLTSIGYTNGVNIVLEILFIGAYTVAGLYYLLKKPVLGMPIKLIVFCLDMTAYLIFMSGSISSFRYLGVAFVFNILWNIFSVVALIIYTPFKKAKA